MTENRKTRRFFYPTQGVCQPEIHFEVREGRLGDVRFVGGGCPGNAQLVSRLLAGKPLDEVLEVVEGIDCRYRTPCPEQLAMAIEAASTGGLKPAQSFRRKDDDSSRKRIGLIGALNGDEKAMEKLLDALG